MAFKPSKSVLFGGSWGLLRGSTSTEIGADRATFGRDWATESAAARASAVDAPRDPPALRDYSACTDLARRAHGGDRGAQRELFRRLRGGVHGTLYRVLGSNDFMEDLIQDAFIEIFRSLPHYRGESLLQTWADRIAARVAFHHLKRKRPRAEREKAASSVVLHVVGSPEDHAQHREGLKRLYGLLRRMKAEDHVALALFMVDGRSLEEVAEMTGVTLVAAKNRVSRARRKLFDAARRDQLLLGYLNERGEA